MEKFNCHNLHIEGGEVHLKFTRLRKPFRIFVGIVEEFSEQVAHHVNDAEGGELVTWHRHHVEADLVRVQATLLHEDALLLCDGRLQHLGPVEDVAVGRGELIGPSKLDQLVNLGFVPAVGRLKRVLFDLQLPLEQVDRIFELWMSDTVKGHSMVLMLVSTVEDQFVELVD